MTELPIEPGTFWGVAALLGVFAVVALATGVIKLLRLPWLEAFKADLDLKRIHPAIVILGLGIWGVLVVLLASGLIWQVWQTAYSWTNQSFGSNETATLVRSRLILLTALTATLGAVVAFPVTLRRLKLTRQQTRTAEESLFNDKIAAAAEDLHARREIRRKSRMPGTEERDYIEDDRLRRTVAIDRLEGLAQERPDQAPRIARLMCVYLRELSKMITPESAEHPRADMIAAAQMLGRLKKIQNANKDEIKFDLRGANLQGFQLSKADLSGADLRNASLERTYLLEADLRNANLSNASLKKAMLMKVNLFGAELINADLLLANLMEAPMDSGTKLGNANLKGAIFRSADYSGVSFSQKQVDEMFGDASVDLPDDISKPERYNRGHEDWEEFLAAWRVHLDEIGLDPDDASTR